MDLINSCALQFATLKEAKTAAGKLKKHMSKIQSLLQVDVYKPKTESDVPENL